MVHEGIHAAQELLVRQTGRIRARGTHRPDSDVDVVVLLEGARDQTMQTKFDMGDVAFDVLLETRVYISPLPIWRDNSGLSADSPGAQKEPINWALKLLMNTTAY